ncbi:MAG: Rrf2 family transcriptional regulator [Acholeplasmatales bacterium]|nr:Rrf2 family transcriptional regulator [Acholeplasmatales bacterium]
MISTKGRYALRVMIDIASYSNGEPVSLKDVSKRQEISVKYLEQVVSLLVKRGYLLSVRGNNGGYLLSKDPKDYTIGDIIRCAEGTLAPVACLQTDCNTCNRSDICSTIDFWKGFYDVVNNYVDSVTLEDLKNKELEKIGNDYSI